MKFFRRARLSEESRFIKSYKYKHKPKKRRKQKATDWKKGEARNSCDIRHIESRRQELGRKRGRILLLFLKVITIISALQQQAANVQLALAFCPFKCVCNDQSLSANCTQVSSISIVPMTLNPLLKELTLQQLPMFELSNSLSVYRKLEYLNLRSNQLRQIKYQNFNLKPAPPSLHKASANHLRLMSEQNVDEDGMRFHLRELDLAENKIEQLGSWADFESSSTEADSEDETMSGRLKASDLERQAPFLTLSKLEILNLTGNRLIKLNKHAFLGLIRLRRLDLSRNYLEFIDKHSFVGLIELEVLNLGQNKLARHLAQLGLAFCRAPMSELKQLDLGDNYKSNNEPQDREVLLPNQMFICTPKLIQLRLNALQLRYIQVSAFDNLLQLESLNLSRNYLEQVPSDSLSFSGSNLSLSLRQLDLSETLIEFVNVRSFARLENLQILHMNYMPMLVSFDLGSLSARPSYLAAAAEGQQQLINEQLIELELSHNPRLQSVHSSLVGAGQKIKFARLRELSLIGDGELRELALEQMMSAGGANLRVDLSHANKLNCSSCQMSWLIEAARHQLRRPALLHLRSAAVDTPPSRSIVLGSDANKLGCAWPFAATLAQLLELEQGRPGAQLLAHCHNHLQRQQAAAAAEKPQAPPEAPEEETVRLASLVVASLVALVLFSLLAAKLATLLAGRKSQFGWRSPSLTTNSGNSPAASSILSAPGANASYQHNRQLHPNGMMMIFANDVGQIERRSNLFSRIAACLSGARNKPSAADLCFRQPVIESSPARLVYGDKILARQQAPAKFISCPPELVYSNCLQQQQQAVFANAQHLRSQEPEALAGLQTNSSGCSANNAADCQGLHKQLTSTFAPASPPPDLPSRLLSDLDNHIYVTLDGPIKQRAEEEYVGCAANSQRVAAAAAGATSQDYKSFEWSQSRTNTRPLKESGAHDASRQFKSGAKLSYLEALRSNNVTTLERNELGRKQLLMDQLNGVSSFERAKYDANHDALAATFATNNGHASNDHVINGSERRRASNAEGGAARGGMRASGCVIGQQKKRAELYERAPVLGVGTIRDSPPSSDVARNHNNSHEIYSNQFYYCKPTTASLAPTPPRQQTTTGYVDLEQKQQQQRQ